jgi:hypothetical protein
LSSFLFSRSFRFSETPKFLTDLIEAAARLALSSFVAATLCRHSAHQAQ